MEIVTEVPAWKSTEVYEKLKSNREIFGKVEIDSRRHYTGALLLSRRVFIRGGEIEDSAHGVGDTAEDAMKDLWAKLTADNTFLTISDRGDENKLGEKVQGGWSPRPVLIGADDYHENNYAWNGVRFVPIKSAGFYGGVEETLAYVNTLKFLVDPLKNHNPDALIGSTNGCRTETSPAQEKYQHIPDGVNITPVGFYFP